MTRPPPPELARLQDDFTRMLRTPLKVERGRFAADLAGIPAALHDVIRSAEDQDGGAGLGVYQRQYWFRLFTVLQTELLLTSRLIGAFHFNRLASTFLLERPPTHQDLGQLVEGFDGWIEQQANLLAGLPVQLPTEAVAQAVAIDMAYRRAWLAPLEPAWTPSAQESAALASGTLRLAPHVTLLREGWPLLEARIELMGDARPEQVPLGAPIEQHWAILRTPSGFGQLRLEPLQAMLYRECTLRPLHEALSRLQDEAPAEDAAKLAARVRAWFAQGMTLGLWAGVEP